MKKTTLKAIDHIAAALYFNGGTIESSYQRGRPQHTNRSVMTLVGIGGDHYKVNENNPSERSGVIWGSTG